MSVEMDKNLIELKAHIYLVFTDVYKSEYEKMTLGQKEFYDDLCNAVMKYNKSRVMEGFIHNDYNEI